MPAQDDIYDELFKEVDSLLNSSDIKTDEGAGDTTASIDVQPFVAEPVVEQPQDVVQPTPTTIETHTQQTTPITHSDSTAVREAIATSIENAATLAVKNAELERRLAEREAALAAKDVVVERPFFDGDIELTAEEAEAYAQNIPVIDKLIKRHLQAYDSAKISKLASQVESLATGVKDVNSQAVSASWTAFAATVNNIMPDLGAKMTTQEWKTAMSSPAPFSGKAAKVQDLWDYAERTQNIQAMMEIAASVKLQADPINTMVAPGSATAPAPAPSRPKAGRLAYSDYLKAMNDQQSGKISWDKWREIEAKFLEASVVGLVDESM